MLHGSLSGIAAASRPDFHMEVKQQWEQKPRQGQGHLNAAGLPCSTPKSFSSGIIWWCIFQLFSYSPWQTKQAAFYPKHIWHAGLKLGIQTDGLLSWTASASSTHWLASTGRNSFSLWNNSQDLDVVVLSFIFWKAVKNDWFHIALRFQNCDNVAWNNPGRVPRPTSSCILNFSTSICIQAGNWHVAGFMPAPAIA